MRLALFSFFMVLGMVHQSTLATEPFGDAVARCAAKSGIATDSPKLNETFAKCEKEIEAQRGSVVEKIDAFQGCLKSSAARLDDKLSPASDIAAAISSDCETAWLAVLIANGQTEKMGEYPSKTVSDFALKTVLETRASARTLEPGKRRTP